MVSKVKSAMKFTRRSFFQHAAALSVAAALPVLAIASPPTIYGDGFGDDTDGLRAALSGKPFQDLSGTVKRDPSTGSITVAYGSYVVRETIVIKSDNTSILNSVFRGKWDGDFLRIDNCSRVMVMNCIFDNEANQCLVLPLSPVVPASLRRYMQH